MTRRPHIRDAIRYPLAAFASAITSAAATVDVLVAVTGIEPPTGTWAARRWELVERVREWARGGER